VAVQRQAGGLRLGDPRRLIDRNHEECAARAALL
jgi:hypothetical protein